MKVTKDQVSFFVMSTAKRFGWFVRATLNNNTGEDFVVHATIRRQDGALLKRADSIGEIKDRDALVIDFQDLCRQLDVVQLDYDVEELLCTLNMIPKKLAGLQEPYELDRKILMRWLYAQDHYTEYYCPKTGFAGGVNYAVAPMNDTCFSPKTSNLVQAPKVIVSDCENTVFQFICFSSDTNLRRTESVICTLRKPSGEKVAQWEESIAVHSMIWVDIKERLQQEGVSLKDAVGDDGFLYFQAYSSDVGFACLAFNVNEKANTFAFEHTLGADYYFPLFKGHRKSEIFSYTKKHVLFAEKEKHKEAVGS